MIKKELYIFFNKKIKKEFLISLEIRNGWGNLIKKILKRKKKGKLLTSHRYNHRPLLSSDPGGLSRSWPYKTCPTANVQLFFILRKKY